MRRESALRALYGRGVVMVSAVAAMSAAFLVGVPTANGAVTATTPWAQMSTPHLAGANPQDALEGVSCPTTTFCMAVGSQIPNSRATQPAPEPLAEVWTGKWKLVPTPIVDQGGYGLTDISCSSPSFCMALPTYGEGFAEIWNGSAWTVTTLPTTTMQSLASVSCVGTDCVAVGSQQLSSGTKFLGFGTLAAEWNGQSWLLDPTSVPGILNSVSCLGVSQCLAVGESEGASGSSGPALAQYFNNGVWSDVSPSTGYLTPLFAVSCVPASVTCSAFESRVAMMVWNASTGTWTASSLPENPFLLVSMSCPTTTWCVATGPSSSYSPVRAVPAQAAAWNGSAWTMMNTGRLGSTGVNPKFPLDDVSCPSSTFCVAVGMKQTLNAQEPLAASWGPVPGSGGLRGL